MTQPGRPNIRVTASDALEFEPVAAEPPKTRWGLRLFIVLVVASGGAGAWHFYGAEVRKLMAGGEGGIPLIKANPEPVKVRPQNPGGLDVPDRDKLVYDRIQGSSGDGVPERLLPPPEQPLPKPRAVEEVPKADSRITPESKPSPVIEPVSALAKPVAAVPTAKDVAAAERPVPPPPPPVPPTASISISPGFPVLKRTAVKQEESPAPPAAVANSPEPAKEPGAFPAPPPAAVAKQPEPAKESIIAATPPPPSPPATTPVSPGRGYLVQLAAARTQEGAETEWEKLRGKNQDLLGNLRLIVTKADLGAKGVYYRLRAGPIADEQAARELCSQLDKRQVGCLIIKPGQ